MRLKGTVEQVMPPAAVFTAADVDQAREMPVLTAIISSPAASPPVADAAPFADRPAAIPDDNPKVTLERRRSKIPQRRRL